MRTVCFPMGSISPVRNAVLSEIRQITSERHARRLAEGRFEAVCYLDQNGIADYEVCLICPGDEWDEFSNAVTIGSGCPDPENTASEIAALLNMKHGKKTQ